MNRQLADVRVSSKANYESPNIELFNITNPFNILETFSVGAEFEDFGEGGEINPDNDSLYQ